MINSLFKSPHFPWEWEACVYCMCVTVAGANMHKGIFFFFFARVKKELALSLLGDAGGLLLTATLGAYRSACCSFTFI